MIIIRNFGSILYLFKIFELTDFSFFTPEIRDICQFFASKITENTTENQMQIFSEDIVKQIIEKVGEKNVTVGYCILKAKNSYKFSIYKHKNIHGKEYDICSKLCVLLSHREFDKEKVLDLASEVIGFDYSNVFLENKYVERQSNFNPLNSDVNCSLSIEAYFEIIKIAEDNRVYMIYSI